MELRPYQSGSVEAVWSYLREQTGNPVVVLPTGSGKTPVLVALARQAVEGWHGRVLILAHVKELLKQAREKFVQWWPFAPVGVYSAGLRKRETDDQIIIAGIQSVFSKSAQLGRFDLVIVDECHLIPAAGQGMYQTLLKDLKVINPQVRVIGLTATPYRLDSGLVYGGDNVLTGICYEANVKDLIEQKFLCRLRGKAGTEADLTGVHTRGGDYIQGELEDRLTDEQTVEKACAEIVQYCAERKAWIIFCAGVEHARMVEVELFNKHKINVATITADTPAKERDNLVDAFKAGQIRALCNVNVLSIGFDAPHTDAVIMLRPTQSPGLYYQQVGRGLRTHETKTDCLILDLAGNIRRHGPIDIIAPKDKSSSKGSGEAPAKTCPKCQEIVHAALQVCPACQFEFPPAPVARHDTKADTVQPLSEPAVESTWRVKYIEYRAWLKRGAPADAPKTLRVIYNCRNGTGNIFNEFSEWVCFEHEGFARRKAERWWAERCSAPCPTVTEQAEAFVKDTANDFAEPIRITVRTQQGKFPEIISASFAKPCEGCVYFDAGHCHKWEQDVPEDHRANGCDSFSGVGSKPSPLAALISTDDEPPF
jgi:DNA repair protein RadD